VYTASAGHPSGFKYDANGAAQNMPSQHAGKPYLNKIQDVALTTYGIAGPFHLKKMPPTTRLHTKQQKRKIQGAKRL